jgi:hypothetical protein
VYANQVYSIVCLHYDYAIQYTTPLVLYDSVTHQSRTLRAAGRAGLSSLFCCLLACCLHASSASLLACLLACMLACLHACMLAWTHRPEQEPGEMSHVLLAEEVSCYLSILFSSRPRCLGREMSCRTEVAFIPRYRVHVFLPCMLCAFCRTIAYYH